MMSKRNFFIALLGFLFADPLIMLALFGATLVLNPFWAGISLFEFGQKFGFIILVIYFFFLLKKRNIFFAKGFALGSTLLILYHFISLIPSFKLPPLSGILLFPLLYPLYNLYKFFVN